MIDRIPGSDTRLRRVIGGIGLDFVPYTGAIKDIDLGTYNLLTTGTITGQLQMGQNLSPTHTTVQHWSDLTQSACVLSGGVISDSGSGQVDVTAAKGVIKTTASDIGANVFFDYAGDTNFVLTNNDLNFLYLTYVDSSNAPTLAVTLEDTDINGQTKILIGWVYRENNVVHILNLGGRFANSLARMRLHDHEVHGFERVTGLVLSTNGSRNVLYTEGIIYSFITRFTVAAFDSSGASRFNYFYRASPSGWTEVTNQSVINNANYDDGDGTLGTLTSNRYGVHWVYAEPNGHTYILYGQGDYKRAEAEDASPPSNVPSHVSDQCLLIGKIIVREGTSTTTVASAFDIKFVATGVDDHNDLGNLQGGAADAYYHLTAAELAEIGTNTTHSSSVGTDHGYIDQDLQTTASPTFANLTVGGEINNLTLLEHDADSWSITGGSGPTKILRVYTSCSINQNLASGADVAFHELTLSHLVVGEINNIYPVSLATGFTLLGGITTPRYVQFPVACNFDQNVETTASVTFADVSITTPVNIYALSHNSFADYAADRHIAHADVTLTAGTGLSGGGTIAASRQFDLDILGLTTDTIAAGDWIPFHDLTDAPNKITFANFESTLNHNSLTNAHNLSTDIDHGGLAGTGDDDHTDYHTDGRAATWLAANHETTYAHADIALNTTHRGSDGTDHGYIDQDVQTTASPSFTGLTVGSLAGVLTATAGVVSATVMPAFRAYLGSNQTVDSASGYKIEIDTVTYDSDSGFNTGTFKYVIPVTGYYTIGCLLTISGTPDVGKIVYIILKKNNVDQLVIGKIIDTSGTRHEAFIDLFCTANEEIEFWIYQDTGVNKTIFGGVATTEIWGHRFK